MLMRPPPASLPLPAPGRGSKLSKASKQVENGAVLAGVELASEAVDVVFARFVERFRSGLDQDPRDAGGNASNSVESLHAEVRSALGQIVKQLRTEAGFAAPDEAGVALAEAEAAQVKIDAMFADFDDRLSAAYRCLDQVLGRAA